MARQRGAPCKPGPGTEVHARTAHLSCPDKTMGITCGKEWNERAGWRTDLFQCWQAPVVAPPPRRDPGLTPSSVARLGRH